MGCEEVKGGERKREREQDEEQKKRLWKNDQRESGAC